MGPETPCRSTGTRTSARRQPDDRAQRDKSRFAPKPKPVRPAIPEGVAILYGWHTVAAALANPRRTIRKIIATENAARRLTEEGLTLPVTPEIVRPDAIAARLSPDAVHQGLLVEADPLPALELEDLAAEGTVLVLDQITDPHNVGAILRSAAAFGVEAVVTTARHSPEATGVLAKSASGALDLVPIVTVQNLARALDRTEGARLPHRRARQRGRDRSRGGARCASRSRWCSAPRARACASSRARPAISARGSICPARSRASTCRTPPRSRFMRPRSSCANPETQSGGPEARRLYQVSRSDRAVSGQRPTPPRPIGCTKPARMPPP